MDRYFYAVEDCGNHKKEVHIFGNVHQSDDGYKTQEYTGFCMSLGALHGTTSTEMFDLLCENVAYEDDLAECEVERVCAEYFSGELGQELHLMDVTNETPCGFYWCEWQRPVNV